MYMLYVINHLLQFETILKGCASNPHDSASQAALQKAAEDLRSATNAAANNALKRKLIRRLEVCMKVIFF